MTGRQYADDPLDDLGADLLERGRLAVRLANVLKAVTEQTDSAVAALVGPWGSGKTTLLVRIEQLLATEAQWHVAHYNPWAYSSLDAAVAGFFDELRTALPEDVLGTDRRGAVGRLAQRMAPFGALGGAIGIDVSKPLEELGRVIGGDQSPEALRSRAAAELRSLTVPVLVILDDLDRLEPNELLLTFKLVRLLGRLPNVYYLLSYDEATLESVLRRTDLVGDEAGRARDYLEKMVQVRLDVPPLLDEHRVALVNECLSDCLQRHHLELDDDANTRLQQAWHNCLRHYLDQPRAIRKLFSQVDLLWPEVEEEVDFVDFLLVTFLRTFERAVHELVLDRREELVGTLADWSLSRRQESHGERWQRWMELMRTAGASRPEAVGLLLAELFLPIRSARENMAYGSSYAADIRRRKGVGSDEFFDRYTQMGVVAKDVSDRLVLRALDEMARGIHGDAVATLEQKLADDARLVTAKLDRLVDRAELPAAALLGLLARHYVASRQQATGPFGMSADFGILLLSLRLLNRLGGAEATAALRELTRTAPGLALAADAMQKATFAEETNHGSWVNDGRGSVVEALEAGILDAAKTPLAETERVVIRWLYALKHLAAEGQARQLIWTILDDDGPWTLEDLLAALVPVGSTSDGRSSWDSLGELDSGGIDELLGLDRALGALQLPEDAAPVSTEPFERRRLPVTFEMRRQYALAVMARLRANPAGTPDAAQE